MIRRVVFSTVFVLACGYSLGDGRGEVRGVLDIPDCWTGDFNLNPDFFAAVRYRNTSLILRIQSGGDYQNFSDGLSILVDDVGVIRGESGGPSLLGTALDVGLSPNVTPPGVPVVPDPNPPPVHVTLYLQRSCRTQLVALYALREVSLNESGECAERTGPAPGCSDASDAGVAAPRGTSQLTFTQVANALPDEPNAAKRLNEATFDLYLADPREICPGGFGPPPKCRGHVTGFFKFYYERGRPAQPFP